MDHQVGVVVGAPQLSPEPVSAGTPQPSPEPPAPVPQLSPVVPLSEPLSKPPASPPEAAWGQRDWKWPFSPQLLHLTRDTVHGISYHPPRSGQNYSLSRGLGQSLARWPVSSQLRHVILLSSTGSGQSRAMWPSWSQLRQAFPPPPPWGQSRDMWPAEYFVSMSCNHRFSWKTYSRRTCGTRHCPCCAGWGTPRPCGLTRCRTVSIHSIHERNKRTHPQFLQANLSTRGTGPINR
jgi:hypothetical protein